MLAIKNRIANAGSVLTLLLALILFGCTPPGPRALLKGEKLIQEGKWEEAILTLQKATQLLPNNAQAWNHLGIAYHGNHQYELALKCYKSALWLDRNLAAARYNLGCLLLEQNDVTGATEQLTSFTFLQPSSADGWLKLGTAQMRHRKPNLPDAEKSFKTALELRSNDPEAFNNLGLIQLQRRRTQEAIAYFKSALAQNPEYGPALLNLAVVMQQNPVTRQQALAHYQKYLGLEPKPADWEKVQAVAAQLDLELNPPPLQLNPVAHAPVKSNAPAVASLTPSNRVVQAKPPATNAASPLLVLAKTQVVAAVTPPVTVATASPPRVAHTTVAAPPQPPAVVTVTNKPAMTIANKPPSVSPVVETAQVTPKPPPLEVAQVREPISVKAPQDPPKAEVPSHSAEPNGLSSPGVKPNPFAVKTRTPTETVQVPPHRLASGENPTSPSKVNAMPAIDLGTVPVPRYVYLSPGKPPSGNRREAEKFYAEGVRLHKAGNLRDAVANYQKAIQLDAAYFEAFYNMGLAAYERGQMKQSLAAYEYALALNPGSIDARYNFALALKQAGYPADAVVELNKVVQARPNEVRAHYSLANLYAQALKMVPMAREHFQKVLDLNPSHPQASEIRFWLANNLQ